MQKRITPGPWTNSIVGIKNAKGLLIAQAWCGNSNNSFGNHPAVSDDEMYANAKLIAAAPDLLKAVEKFVEAIEDEEGTFDSCVGLAKDAYNKATGAKLTYHQPIRSNAEILSNAAPELLEKLVLMVKALETEGGYEVYHNDLKEAKELCNKIAPETFIH